MEIRKMKNIKKNNILPKVPDHLPFPIEHTLFLDIETTGFSGSRSRLYLIGAAYVQNETLITEQFFAESLDEEPLLLAALEHLSESFDTVVTFYGNRFDLPFMEKCRERLHLDSVSHNINYVDLYPTARSYKHLFGLANAKQKTLELFFGHSRKDTYSGGELIKIYASYVKDPQPELLELLLLHNLDDVLGMIHLLSLFTFDAFVNGGFQPESCTLVSYRKMDGSVGKELSVVCRPDLTLPAVISCKNDHFYLHAKDGQVCFRITLLEGVLKYFYPNYKDYYYLPKEDMAIHKSVASYVDASHREKAKAATCYSKKAGVFLPQYEEVVTPALFTQYKDSVSYFEWTDACKEDRLLIKRYCLHILQTLKKGS